MTDGAVLLQAARPIQILPAEIVERIAAGEVVERPVSVVRELLDNALDAGAGEIRVEIRGGGLRSIRVADDGEGIPPDQLDLAVRHHATSKIRDFEDLLEVTSLGFRGEALPSIAAVSEVSLLSAHGANPLGARLDLRFGEPEGRGFASRTHGTTVTVRNLFANLPVRLKFIGDARTESRLISQLVRRYALAHAQVRFSLWLDGHASLHTSGLGLEQAMGEVFGGAVSAALLPIGPLDLGPAALTGFVSAQHVTRSSRHHITLLVNNRCVGSRTLLAAFEEGYRTLLPRGRHPVALLSLSMPRSRVDVNVHPSKAEVKVRDEAALAAGIKEAARDVLGRSMHAPGETSNFAVGASQFELPHMVAEQGSEWDVASGARLRAMHVTGQVHGALILVEDARGLYLIDQHRAHERAIYELLCRRHAEGRAGQLLLEPIHLQLSANQLRRLEPRLPELADLGFSCEWFGGRSFLVRAVPVVPETENLADAVEDLLDLAAAQDSDWQHRLLTSVACHAATKRGRVLTPAQCKELIDLLADTESPAICPHGSPIILHFSDRFLERQFNW